MINTFKIYAYSYKFDNRADIKEFLENTHHPSAHTLITVELGRRMPHMLSLHLTQLKQFTCQIDSLSSCLSST